MNSKPTRFKLAKANVVTYTHSILAVTTLRSKGWIVVHSNFGELI